LTRQCRSHQVAVTAAPHANHKPPSRGFFYAWQSVVSAPEKPGSPGQGFTTGRRDDSIALVEQGVVMPKLELFLALLKLLTALVELAKTGSHLWFHWIS
jgi:hypothetical protein